MYHVISQHGNSVCRFRHCRLRFHEAHGYSPKHTRDRIAWRLRVPPSPKQLYVCTYTESNRNY